MKKKILILFGGKSCEHDISIISTFQSLKYFDEYLYDLVLVYIDSKGIWKLVEDYSNMERFLKDRDKLKIVQLGINENILYVKKNKKYKPLTCVDVVFPILHGINGEDGCVMGLLKMSDIPFVGCDHISSAIGIDKSLFKKVCSSKDVLPMQVINKNQLLNKDLEKRVEQNIGFPCIIKPCKLGSSIGIEKCEKSENLLNLLKKSLNFDEKVVVEPYVKELREFNVALYKLGGELVVSDIEEPLLKDEILSFKDKYLNFSDQYIAKNIPAKVSEKLKEKIISLAQECYLNLNCSGVVRVDFIYDKTLKKLYINEINTIPGALALYLFEAKGVSRVNVINDVINEALRVFNQSENIVTKYNSGVLEKQDFSKFNRV